MSAKSFPLKIGDIALVAAILISAVLLFFCFGRLDGGIVSVVQNGKEIYRFGLNDSRWIGKDIEIDGACHNTLRIENGEVYVAAADCPDQVCVHSAPVSENGGVICCVPNGLTVTVQKEQKWDVIIR